jgi:hypothetical protein
MRTLYGHTLYFALRRIFPGEEMTVPYLLGPPDEETCDPCHHACLCGSPVCTGTWHLSDEKHQRWSDYENDIAEKYPPKRVKPGQPLPKLDKYPKTISDNPVFDLFGYDNIEPAVYDDETLPKVPELRKRIRETGRRLDFPKFHQTVYGILNGLVVSKDY